MREGTEAMSESPDDGLSCRMITNLEHQMISYIERKRGDTSMGEAVQYSNKTVNNWARARMDVKEPVGIRKGPAGIKLNRSPWAKLKGLWP